jgi:hypothetical protein
MELAKKSIYQSFGSKVHSISIEERFVVVGEYFFRIRKGFISEQL